VLRNQIFNEARRSVTKLVVLLTDGKANRNANETITEANLIKAENVEVFAVGITNDVR